MAAVFWLMAAAGFFRVSQWAVEDALKEELQRRHAASVREEEERR